MELAGVEFRADVAAFEAVKGRLSNAAHMLMCYPSLQIGHRFVDEGMREARIAHLLRNFWDLDALRLVEPPAGFSTRSFTAQVLDRFANPAIKDRLLRVAGDGAAKINVFHAKTLGQLIAQGADITREAFLLASFAHYLRGVDDRGASFEVIEPQLNDADWRAIRAGDPLALLRASPFRGLGLDGSPAFAARFQELAHCLATDGAAATLDAILV
jgi:mannitol-1-phosphate/altronate dehydrogenase